ncbi:MAG TPA: hypothetical protein VG537_08505 [Candidatus Kapabacteria bacterium]|jgi:hypothetical protein|nr:hypothetical protein [Candidatus Kapabacteria bacterium]
MQRPYGFGARMLWMFAVVIGGLFVSITYWSCSPSNSPATSPNGSFQPSGIITPGGNAPDWSHQPAFVQQAIGVQNRHSNDMMRIAGVVGTGVGIDDQNPNIAVIEIFTEHEGIAGIPSTIEGMHTRIENVGRVTIFKGYTGKYRSRIPAGVSVGDDDECAAGSIGAMVTSSGMASSPQSGAITTYGHNSNYSWTSGTRVYMLSCNHVFANEDAATAADAMDQPGRYDNSCNTGNNVGTLYAWNYISSTANNLYDAALAECNPSISGGWTGYMSPQDTYAPASGSSAVNPTVGMAVEKVGRTTGLTTGSIAGINVTITVSYTNYTATFVHQIYVRGSFIKAGDSGSMMVTNNSNHYPVGLNFAGGSNSSFANPIKPIEQDFGLSFVSGSFGN